MLETKRSKVVRAVIAGDYVKAMKIAKGFIIELNKEENTVVRRAYEMTWNAAFYEALGFNAEEEFSKAVEILKSKFAEPQG